MLPSSHIFARGWNKGAGHHEIRFRADCHHNICNGGPGAASDYSKRVDSSKLHCGTHLVPDGVEAVSTRAHPDAHDGEFAADPRLDSQWETPSDDVGRVGACD